jgi:4-alpha-glucanotransferase
LKELAGGADENSIVVFADDGEKFGGWPGTYKYIFKEGWLDAFFSALEANESLLQTVLPSEYSHRFAPRAELDLPPGSYPEMQEWSGGDWRNFLRKYDESCDIYQEIKRVGQCVRAQPQHPHFDEALTHVLRAQANDALWHGVFGGLYLRHLRQALYREIISAQVLLDGSKPFARALDNHNSTVIENELQSLGVRPGGGHVYLWNSKKARHNILSTLRRYRETYHDADAPVDWHPRGALLDHFFGEGTTPENFASARYAEQGDFCSEAWNLSTHNCDNTVTAILQRDGNVWIKNAHGEPAHAPLRIEKTIKLRAGSPVMNVEYSFCNTGSEEFCAWWASEWNIALSGAELPERHFHGDDHKAQQDLNAIATFAAVLNPIVADRWLELWIEWKFNEPLAMWHVPIHTVSQKEGGATEKTHQSSAFVFHKKLQLAPGKEQKLRFDVEVTTR